jgi:Helix-turn-helix domain
MRDRLSGQWSWADSKRGDGQRSRLTQADLAQRWRLSERTLEKWRSTKRGPPFVKVGSRVIYRIEDVEAYEAAQLRGER